MNQFESIDEDIRDEHAAKLYMHMWKIAFRAGKLSLANNYAKKFLNYLIENKRVPQIKTFLNTVDEAGLLKNNTEEYLKISDILLGKKIKINSPELKNIELFLDHPEHWKQSSEFLKQYLLIEEEWSLELWKFCYEFILLFHFDKDIFLALLEKSRELKNKEFEKKILSLLDSRKVKASRYRQVEVKEPVPKTENLNSDYDQIAMELLSGAKEPSFEEQRRVINSLKYITDEELFSRGQDMVVAFELLGMEQVVLSLCERIIVGLSDVKQRASVFYVWVQALINAGEFYKAIDLADEVLLAEPVYGDERLAFQYIKAEACLKVNKIKMAKEIYISIRKQNPHYRLVGERLKSLEAN